MRHRPHESERYERQTRYHNIAEAILQDEESDCGSAAERA